MTSKRFALCPSSSPLFVLWQLLWVNLIMNTMAALALATEPPTPDLLKRRASGAHVSPVTMSLCHYVSMSVCHYVTMSLCHYVTMSHGVTLAAHEMGPRHCGAVTLSVHTPGLCKRPEDSCWSATGVVPQQPFPLFIQHCI